MAHTSTTQEFLLCFNESMITSNKIETIRITVFEGIRFILNCLTEVFLCANHRIDKRMS